MTAEEAAFEVLASTRNVGATLKQVGTNIAYRTKDKSQKKRALEILEALATDGQLVSVGDKWFLTPKGAKRAKGSARRAEWERADAWIFVSVLQSCRPGDDADLSRVIGAADYLDHAIPTRAELYGAINRLLAAKLLQAKRGKLSLTPRAEELWKKVGSRRGRSPVRDMRALMDCPCCGVDLDKVRWGFQLDAKEYDDLVAAYRASF
jgi:hypothetical protein